MELYTPIQVMPLLTSGEITLDGARPWRMNLMACSKRLKSTFFIAVHNEIHVYKLPQLSAYSRDDTPQLQRQSTLRINPSDTTSSSSTSTNTELQTINAIHIGEVGPEEMLVAVDEFGCVTAWFTAALEHPPIRLEARESAWGIATQGPAYLLAVSANSHHVIVWDLHDYFVEPEPQHKPSWDTTRRMIRGSTWIDTKERLREQRNTTRFLPRRTTIRSVEAPLGEGCKQRELIGHTHNVPGVSMSACGRWLASCSIDGTVRVWRLYDGQCIMQRRFGSDWGWSVQFVQPGQFKHIPPSVCDPSSILQNSASSSSRDDAIRSLAVRDWGEWLSGETTAVSREQLVEALLRYIEANLEEDTRTGQGVESADNAGADARDTVQEGSTTGSDDSNMQEAHALTQDEEENIYDDRSMLSDDNMQHEDNHESDTESSSLLPAAPAPAPASAPQPHTDPRWPRDAWPIERHSSEDARASYWIPTSIRESVPERDTASDTDSISDYPTFGEENEDEADTDWQGDPYTIDGWLYNTVTPSSTIPNMADDTDQQEILQWAEVSDAPSNPLRRPPRSTSSTSAYNVLSPLQARLLPLISQNINLERGLIPLPRDMDEMSEVDTTAATIYSEDRNTLIGTDDGNSSVAADDDLFPSSNNYSNTRISVGIGGDGARNQGVVTFSLRPGSSATTTTNNNEQDEGNTMSLPHPPPSSSSASSSIFGWHFGSNRPRFDSSISVKSTGSTTAMTESLPNELDRGILLLTTGSDAYLLDVEADLEQLDHYRRVVARADVRVSRLLNPFDRLNMTQWIPELNLAVIASQKGRIALMRLVRLCNLNNEDRYVLHSECYLPAFVDMPSVPLLGFFITRNPLSHHDTKAKQDGELIDTTPFSYYIYILYYDGSLLAYELCRNENATNPVNASQRIL